MATVPMRFGKERKTVMIGEVYVKHKAEKKMEFDGTGIVGSYFA